MKRRVNECVWCREPPFMVQGGAKAIIEDGLGVDGLRCKFRLSGCTRYSAEVLKGKQSLRTC